MTKEEFNEYLRTEWHKLSEIRPPNNQLVNVRFSMQSVRDRVTFDCAFLRDGLWSNNLVRIPACENDEWRMMQP